MTVRDVYNAINYDEDAKAILKHFIDSGYENFIMKDFVTQNPKGVYRKYDGDKIVNIYSYELKKVITKELRNKEQEKEMEMDI